MGDIIQSLKEFIWDVIGYMLPGFLLIILLNLFLQPSVGIDDAFLFDWNIFGDYLPIVVSYILGYVLFSLSLLKNNIQNILIDFLRKINTLISENTPAFKIFLRKCQFPYFIYTQIQSSHSEYWLIGAQKSSTFASAKKFLKNGGYEGVDGMKFNEIRNILMSRNPLMDQKVYTFRFRSVLFDHISTVLILIIIAFFINNFGAFNYFKKENLLNVLIFVFLIIVPLLGKSKRMFNSISQRIPLSNLK